MQPRRYGFSRGRRIKRPLIENIRNVTDKMGAFPMSSKAEARVFVFDECHSLLKPAAEALTEKM